MWRSAAMRRVGRQCRTADPGMHCAPQQARTPFSPSPSVHCAGPACPGAPHLLIHSHRSRRRPRPSHLGTPGGLLRGPKLGGLVLAVLPKLRDHFLLRSRAGGAGLTHAPALALARSAASALAARPAPTPTPCPSPSTPCPSPPIPARRKPPANQVQHRTERGRTCVMHLMNGSRSA